MARIKINMKKGEVRKQDVIIGIDLGTTNSLVAYVKNEEVVVVKDIGGIATTVPSVIYFDSADMPVVGMAAKQALLQNPERTIYSVKRLMGKSYNDLQQYSNHLGYRIIDQEEESLVKVAIGNKYYTPVELSAIILSELKSRVENDLGTQVSKAVITVPAYFNDAQRQATRDAGKLAGLDVLRIINEPTAAALAYGLQEIKNDANAQKIAVYDLGGGTFDMSILNIEDGIFEVLSTKGDTLLGGDDIDRRIVEYWMATRPELQDKDTQYLRLCAEDAKITLSGSPSFEKNISHPEITLKLSREEFREITSPLINRTLKLSQEALQDAGLTKNDIDHIIAVGGSTRSTMVKEMVSDFFQKEVYDGVNPDEVVAIGAAIQADILSGNNKKVLLLDVTPLSLGIETVGGLVDVIIPRNNKIPTKASRQYTTSVDGQKNLKVSIYQGERDLVEHNRKLGEFILSDIPPMPAGIPKIEISFMLDADGILIVQARELRSGLSQQIQVKPAYGISEEDMARMLKESLEYADQDVQTKALIEAKNEGTHIIQSLDKFLEQNESWLSVEEKATLDQLAQNLIAHIQSGTKDEINAAMEALNIFSRPLAEKAMDLTIKKAMTGKKISAQQ